MSWKNFFASIPDCKQFVQKNLRSRITRRGSFYKRFEDFPGAFFSFFSEKKLHDLHLLPNEIYGYVAVVARRYQRAECRISCWMIELKNAFILQENTQQHRIRYF